MPLHLTKVAYGAQSLDELRGWFADGEREHRLTTRYLPTRHAEITPGDGSPHGSLFWIFKHQLVMRSPILRFEATPEGKVHIVVAASLIAVSPLPRRAHQGWRYLADNDAPRDLTGGETRGEPMPGELIADLSRLGLI